MMVTVTVPDDVVQRGMDVTGRKAWASDYWWNLWEQMLWALPFGDRLRLFQSPWQIKNGGGARASSSYHNGAGAGDGWIDDLSPAEVADLIAYLRDETGAPAWERGPGLPGDFADHHVHWDWQHDPGWRYPGLNLALADYVAGGNGLSGAAHGPDYHPRPSPLVLAPTREALMGLQDDVRKIVQEETGAAVWGAKLAVLDGPQKGREISAGLMLRQTHNRVATARLVEALTAKLLEELPGGSDAAVVKAAVEAAIRETLGSLND